MDDKERERMQILQDHRVKKSCESGLPTKNATPKLGH